MKRLSLLGIMLIMLAPCVCRAADGDDIGSWTTIQAVKSWDRASAGIRLEHRRNQDLSAMQCWFITAFGGYSFTPWFKLEGGYEYWDFHSTDAQHRLVANAIFSYKAGGLNTSLRERYECQISNGDGTVNSLLRSRLKAQYTFSKDLFRPYVAIELFAWKSWSRVLNYVGTEIRTGDLGSFDLFYCYNISPGSVPIHVFGAGYTFKL